MHIVRFPLQTPLGELTALPRPLAVFKGSTSKVKRDGRRNGREMPGKRRGREGRSQAPNILA